MSRNASILIFFILHTKSISDERFSIFNALETVSVILCRDEHTNKIFNLQQFNHVWQTYYIFFVYFSPKFICSKRIRTSHIFIFVVCAGWFLLLKTIYFVYLFYNWLNIVIWNRISLWQSISDKFQIFASKYLEIVR